MATERKTQLGRDAEALEALVDRHSLQTVLTMLEVICDDKAAHLQTNWQDMQAARMWLRAGRSVATAARTKAVNALP